MGKKKEIPKKTAGRRRKQPLYDAVIFDIDNVLINTSRSYLDTVRWTVETYLSHGKVPLFTPAPKKMRPALLSPKDVNFFKLLGGFNDDWDCCYGILVYLLTLPVKNRTILSLKQQIDLKKFARKVKEQPLRVTGIVKLLGRPPFVMIEKISRIFQEVYLGRDLFMAREDRESMYWKKRGLILKERLAFKKTGLMKLKDLGLSLGITTGRSHFEAEYSLKHFGIFNLFDEMTTMDEVKDAERDQKQSLRKPHPFSVLETARKLGADKRFLYIGDLPDDILTVHKAKKDIRIDSVSYPWLSPDAKHTTREIKKANPDFILKKPSDLIPLILGRKIR
ncbi:MAG: HAD hydrolase-like protein [Candidatus Omnitrophota bacterium]|nr:HAD hydrolase-like protein [Candidatus Omnitrophota bacterium]